VDVSSTVPYGNVARSSNSSWSEIELFPTATAVSNMNILGVVKGLEAVSVSTAGGSVRAVQLVVSIEGDVDEQEDLVVRVFGDELGNSVRDTVSMGATVAATGVLRLNPTHDSQSNKYFSTPALHVTASSGTLCRVL
jgi:hypothetical protein